MDELSEAYLPLLTALAPVQSARVGAAKNNRATSVLKLRLRGENATRELPLVVMKRDLSVDLAELLFAGGLGAGHVVFAPSIPKDARRALSEHAVNFVDSEGNIRLHVPPGIFVQVDAPKKRARRAAAGEAGLRSASYRVIFALLAQPALLNCTMREVAHASEGVSPQTVSNVFAWLFEHGFALVAGNRFRWSPGRRADLFELWLVGAMTSLYPKLVLGRFRAVDSVEPRVASLSPEIWRWGGGVAAEKLTHYYRGEMNVVYLDSRERATDVTKTLRLVPDPQGSVLLVERPGLLAWESVESDCVHPILVFYDLAKEGTPRAREAAQILRERFITTLLEVDV